MLRNANQEEWLAQLPILEMDANIASDELDRSGLRGYWRTTISHCYQSYSFFKLRSSRDINFRFSMHLRFCAIARLLCNPLFYYKILKEEDLVIFFGPSSNYFSFHVVHVISLCLVGVLLVCHYFEYIFICILRIYEYLFVQNLNTDL